MTATLTVQECFTRFHAMMSVYVTNRCNLRCRHCGTGSGPNETTELELDERTIGALKAAIEAGGFCALHVSGGEPFLNRSRLRKLSSLAQEHEVALGVNTNGFWGTTKQRAIELLERLPGITQIILSTDVWHAEFLDVDRVVTAACAALHCGKQVDVYTVTPFAQPNAFTDDVDRRLKEAGILDRVRRFITALGPTAREKPLPDDQLPPWREELPAGPCSLLNRPTVLEDGAIFACCNTTVAARCAESPLVLGSIGETPLPDILGGASRDPILKAIRGLGPAYLVELLGDDARSAIRPAYRENDICSLCTDVVTQPALVARLRERLAPEAVARFVDVAFAMETSVRPSSAVPEKDL